ncbi:MoxR family ATPase [Arenibacter sp. F26102]|uniref:AAA family ATPase n=1 Tax=Arenibacter sp. F26102 TaxID=2926416 RepID=UPI001FF3E1C8|nr:MoxR family ATPase [Arenibacter sp. F26102]MCK0145024.1 MoxR family ATPase [Arenibacter sp. F26102]
MEEIQKGDNNNPLEFKSRIDLGQLQTSVAQIKSELGRVIIGQQDMIELLIISILANGHSLIEGVPGVAKTVTAKLLAKTMDVGFSRIQFTPDLMPSDILGTSIFNAKTSEFEFKKGPLFSNIILIDEINRAPAKTQAALFEAMAERQITMDGLTYEMEPPFLVFATQNPIEQEGTYRLPEAQLDRFLFKIKVNYPSLEEEIQILESKHRQKNKNIESLITSVLTAKQIAKYQDTIKEIIIEDNLMKYIAGIVNNTRSNANLYLGASPRASIAIMDASKALAAINGRDFVTPDDIKKVAVPILMHRVLLTPEREMEGFTPDKVIKQILETIQIPR